MTNILGNGARKQLNKSQFTPVKATKFDMNYNPVERLVQFEDMFSFTLARQYANSLVNLEPIEHETTSEEMVEMKRNSIVQAKSDLYENVPFIHSVTPSKENIEYLG